MLKARPGFDSVINAWHRPDETSKSAR